MLVQLFRALVGTASGQDSDALLLTVPALLRHSARWTDRSRQLVGLGRVEVALPEGAKSGVPWPRRKRHPRAQLLGRGGIAKATP